MTPKQKWFLVGVILLAITFRFYQIMAMPGGLFPDEAANGLDINSMQAGQLQPFYERGNGREALFFYMLWGSVEIFGKGPWQHHIISALVGVIAVLGCFLVTRQLFKFLGGRDEPENSQRATSIALLASFFMAVSSWHVVLSRTAFRANLIPLFTAFTFYFLLLAASAQTRARRYLWAAFSGATFALGFYSYIAYRILVPVIAVAVLWPLLVDIWQTPRFQNIKKFFAPTVIAGAAFAIFIAPLFHYFYTHPGSFVGRSGQVSIFNPDLNGGDFIGVLLEVTRLSLKAYFWDGDLNWRHNISGEPFLSIIISPFFALGLIGVTLLAVRYVFQPLKRRLDWKYFLLAGWFWAMLIPVVTTAEGIPHGLRAIGTIPVVFIMTAVGLRWVMDWAAKVCDKFWPQLANWQKSLLNFAFGLKTVVFIVALILQTYFVYFVYAANSPENFYAFRSDLTVVSEYLKTEGNKNNTYLVLDKFSVQTPDYLTSDHGNPYRQVDPEDAWKLTGLKSGDKIVFAQSSLFDITKFKRYFPEARLALEKRNQFNQTVMAVYVID
jgi:4-amino-4-deoxy-L-arabinose transferase-like glycosyltransferase